MASTMRSSTSTPGFGKKSLLSLTLKAGVRQTMLLLVCALLIASLPVRAATPTFVDYVRASFKSGSSRNALEMLASYKNARGVTPEYLDGLSWVARRELSVKSYDDALRFAAAAYSMATEQLKTRKLDAEPHLPLAIGASIEVTATAAAAQGRLSEAVTYLNEQEKLFAATSIVPRIRKNLLLLTLEGKPAPALIGVTLPKGKPAILFFWAHWCPDCKAEVPVLQQVLKEFPGVSLVAPTQLYGYVAGGEDASPFIEIPYIEQIRAKFYPSLIPAPAIVNQTNFTRYGASTTPTMVIVDRAGIVRKYHPGAMKYEELRAALGAAGR